MYKNKFGKNSIFICPTQHAESIAELASKMTNTNGWHSCDFLFYKKDNNLYYLDSFRIRKASKKILKQLLIKDVAGIYVSK